MRKSPYRLHPRAIAASRQDTPQRIWIVFGGRADQPWLRLLRPGFRHCFAAIEDEHGWMVADPLSGRLLLGRLALAPGFDLPRRYALAGLVPVGPFVPGPPRRRWLPPILPYSCVVLCRELLGTGAPFALTPRGLFRRLAARIQNIGKNT
jgi:hypothetical protein